VRTISTRQPPASPHQSGVCITRSIRRCATLAQKSRWEECDTRTSLRKHPKKQRGTGPPYALSAYQTKLGFKSFHPILRETSSADASTSSASGARPKSTFRPGAARSPCPLRFIRPNPPACRNLLPTASRRIFAGQIFVPASRCHPSHDSSAPVAMFCIVRNFSPYRGISAPVTWPQHSGKYAPA